MGRAGVLAKNSRASSIRQMEAGSFIGFFTAIGHGPSASVLRRGQHYVLGRVAAFSSRECARCGACGVPQRSRIYDVRSCSNRSRWSWSAVWSASSIAAPLNNLSAGIRDLQTFLEMALQG